MDSRAETDLEIQIRKDRDADAVRRYDELMREIREQKEAAENTMKFLESENLATELHRIYAEHHRSRPAWDWGGIWDGKKV